MKECNTCLVVKPLDEFYKNKCGKYTATRNECKPCLKLKQTAGRFGLTVETLKQMYEAQGYSCKICKEPCSVYENLSIDHDHRCCPENGRSCGKCVRGLLCSHCNKALGGFRDNAALLASAIEYLGDRC